MNRSPREHRSWRFALVIGAVAACCACCGAVAEGAGGMVHGRVTGQDSAGEHLGPVAGASVEFLGAGGAAAGSATSDANGYFRVEGLAPGDFTYRIAAEGYEVEDKGRGFSMPEGDEACVLDFILTGAPEAPEMPGAPAAGSAPGVHGRVTGQDDRGEHLGPLAGTLVEFLDGSGAVAASMETNEHGYYRFDALAAGNYRYRLTAEGFRKEDEGRGFELRADAGMQVLDFILSKGNREEEAPGRLYGHVWVESQGARQPVAGARVLVVNDAEGRSAAIDTDREGFYEFMLPAAQWRASATAEPYGSKVHPEAIAIPSGGEERVDFVFTEATMACLEVYILAAVERLPNEAGEAPQQNLLMGPEGQASGEVAGLRVEDLGADPRGSDFFRKGDLEIDDAMEGTWRWYLATHPRCAVAPGVYHAAGKLAGYRDDVSGARTASREWPVILDLIFVRVRPEIEIFVNTKDREPLPEVQVRLVNRSLGRALEEATICVTDEKGMSRAVLEDGLGEYNVMLVCEGYESQVRDLVADREKIQWSAQMFRVGEIPTVDLAGVVIEKMEGGPRAGAEAVAVGNAMLTLASSSGQALPAGLSQPVVTGRDGEFEVKSLAEGEYAVTLGAEGYRDWEGTLSVALGMGPAILELEPINAELENHIRMILTEGWGPPGTAIALRHHQLALKEDPEDCRVDYALGLAFFSATNIQGGIEPLGQAVGKKSDTIFWDRACEARIWAQMFMKAGPVASDEILALCQHHYAQREPNEGSLETAFVAGVAVGVLNGPWNSDERARQSVELDAACLAALQDPHRSEYVRGKESVSGQYGKLAEAQGAEKGRLKEAAEAEKQRMIAEGGARTREIEGQLNSLAAQAAALNADTAREISRWETNIRGFTLQRQQLASQYASLQARINQINACMSQDQVEYQRYMSNAEQTMAPQANAVLQEIQQHQQELAVINNQMQSFHAQDLRYQTSIAQAQAEYNRLVAQQQQNMGTLQAQEDALRREYEAVQRGMAAPVDPNALQSTESQNLERAKMEFITYRTFPLEQRRQELLNAVTR